MILATKLRSGVTFAHRGDPWRVVSYKHVHLSRGSGRITVKARNLRSGVLQSFAFRSGEKVEEVQVERANLSFLYRDGEHLVFMDQTSFEQSRIPAALVGREAGYLVDGESFDVLFWGDEVIGVDIPAKVVLEVASASPGVKGDTVSGATKDVTLVNGLRIRAPLFVKAGDRIVVDTRSGEYVERAG